MDPELATFLRLRTTDFEQSIVWRGGEHRLQLRGYFTAEPPPDRYVLAGRALVVEDDRVLVVRDPENEHVLPGGRLEPGETTVQAVHREVLEETGWSISHLAAFSVLHLHYETPEPKNVGRVIYPDFLWHVFVARPCGFDPKARHTDGWEVGAAFRPISQVLAQPLQPFQRILLEHATRISAAQAT
jgi:8-oxo-dGTP pyrophosphatase MutT (NUDIX family)